MRTPTILIALGGLLLGFSSCVKDKCERKVTYVKTTPIYLAPAEYRFADLDLSGARDLDQPGKIYFYNDFIFINEQREGVHIIDNANPLSPSNIGFLEIPGNVDIAIADQTLYADNYTALLTIDISNINRPQLVKRSEDIFPHQGENNTGQRLLYYDHEEITEVVSCDDADALRQSTWGNVGVFNTDLNSPISANGSSESSVGTGGSLARFTISNQHLYTVNEWQMQVFQIGADNCPNPVSTVDLGWGIETIFPHDNKLFIGSNSGMTIYSLADPSKPDYLSGYSHLTACDPVFVKDNYAYVTLRSGTLCNGSTLNQLDLIDISDIRNIELVKSFPMDNPHGLSIRDNNLFLCEGEYGLKVFDIEAPLRLDESQIEHLTGRAATDVIAIPDQRKLLLVIGEDGFYQYNFDDPKALQELSFIPVTGLR